MVDRQEKEKQDMKNDIVFENPDNCKTGYGMEEFQKKFLQENKRVDSRRKM